LKINDPLGFQLFQQAVGLVISFFQTISRLSAKLENHSI